MRKYEPTQHAKKLDLSLLSQIDHLTYQDDEIIIIQDSETLLQFLHDGMENDPIVPEINIGIHCLQGNLSFDINGRRHTLNASQVAICPPQVILSNYQFSPDFKCTILIFTTNILYESLQGFISHWNHVLYVDKLNVISLKQEDEEMVDYYFRLLQFKFNHPDAPYYQQTTQQIFKTLLLELCGRIQSGSLDIKAYDTAPLEPTDAKVSPSLRKDSLFNQFLEMLNTEPQKRHPVAYYADRLYVSPKYLSTVCNKESGKTALDWIQEFELEEIRFHLSNTELSVKEVAARCGFDNLSFFGRYVRKYLGCSPRAYREHLLQAR